MLSTGSTETSWLFNNNRQSSNFTALYSCFDLIDFISLSGSLNISYNKFPSSDMLKTPVASLKTSSCVSCLAASVARQTSSNAFEIWVQQKYFLLASLPQHHPPKSVLPIMISWKSTATQNLFESLCAQVRTLLDFACLWSCVLVYQHVPCLWHIDCHCYAGKWGWISMKKEEQKTIHKQWEWQKEWKIHKMSYISVWDRRRDLFKLSESSFLSDACIQCFPPPLWIPNDPCTKYSSLDRVLVWAVFPSETEQCWKEACFALGVHCFVF